MPINVEVRDENGSADGPAWDGFLHVDFWAVTPPTSRCLGFVDPYGDTVFNSHQVPVLVDELRDAISRLAEQDRPQLESLVRYITSQRTWIHRYLVFVGD